MTFVNKAVPHARAAGLPVQVSGPPHRYALLLGGCTGYTCTFAGLSSPCAMEIAWQEYIRSSGVRALTRSATAPSAITGGETVEQLEVRVPGLHWAESLIPKA